MSERSELDALLERARRVEPEPLEDPAALATRALAALAMPSELGFEDGHDAAYALRGDSLDDSELDGLLLADLRRARRRRGLSLVAGAATVAAVAVVTFALWSDHTTPTSAAPRAFATDTHETQPELPEPPAELTLATGDRITSSAGARLEVAELSPERRQIDLAAGEAVFDVAPGRGSFVVRCASGVSVRVLGTVFGVSSSEQGTRVHVFEGRVEVARDGTTSVLTAGESWSFEQDAPLSDPLLEVGRAAAEARDLADAPERAASDAPRVATAPARAPPEDPTTAPERPTTVEPTAPTERAGWWLARADELQASNQPGLAAEAYERAALYSTGPSRHRAGFASARIWLRVGDADAALRVLDSSDADEVGSPLEERARVLRIRAEQRLGNDTTALEASYRARFPRSTNTF